MIAASARLKTGQRPIAMKSMIPGREKRSHALPSAPPSAAPSPSLRERMPPARGVVDLEDEDAGDGEPREQWQPRSATVPETESAAGARAQLDDARQPVSLVPGEMPGDEPLRARVDQQDDERRHQHPTAHRSRAPRLSRRATGPRRAGGGTIRTGRARVNAIAPAALGRGHGQRRVASDRALGARSPSRRRRSAIRHAGQRLHFPRFPRLTALEFGLWRTRWSRAAPWWWRRSVLLRSLAGPGRPIHPIIRT